VPRADTKSRLKSPRDQSFNYRRPLLNPTAVGGASGGNRSRCPEVDIVQRDEHLLFSLSACVAAILVKNQVRDLPVRSFDELQLSIRNF